VIVVCVRLLRDELDEVATRVVEDGHDGAADVRRRLREHHALSGQPDVLGVDVVDGELSEWNAVLNECIPIWLHGGVARRPSRSSGPSGDSGDTTVSQESLPTGMSRRLVKPSTSV